MRMKISFLYVVFSVAWVSLSAVSANHDPTPLDSARKMVGNLVFGKGYHVATIKKIIPKEEDGAFEITFSISSPGLKPEKIHHPGDLIQLRKSSKSCEIHEPHIYALSEFSRGHEEGIYLCKIIITPRYRLGVKSAPSIFQPLSTQLCRSEVGNTSYRIRFLQANIEEEFWREPIFWGLVLL
jgi:hypothetical protein